MTLTKTLNELQHIRLDDHGYLVRDFHGYPEGVHFHDVQAAIESEFSINLEDVL